MANYLAYAQAHRREYLRGVWAATVLRRPLRTPSGIWCDPIQSMPLGRAVPLAEAVGLESYLPFWVKARIYTCRAWRAWIGSLPARAWRSIGISVGWRTAVDEDCP